MGRGCILIFAACLITIRFYISGELLTKMIKGFGSFEGLVKQKNDE